MSNQKFSVSINPIGRPVMLGKGVMISRLATADLSIPDIITTIRQNAIVSYKGVVLTVESAQKLTEVKPSAGAKVQPAPRVEETLVIKNDTPIVEEVEEEVEEIQVETEATEEVVHQPKHDKHKKHSK